MLFTSNPPNLNSKTDHYGLTLFLALPIAVISELLHDCEAPPEALVVRLTQGCTSLAWTSDAIMKITSNRFPANCSHLWGNYVTCSIAHSCILPPRKTKWRHEGTLLQAEQSLSQEPFEMLPTTTQSLILKEKEFWICHSWRWCTAFSCSHWGLSPPVFIAITFILLFAYLNSIQPPGHYCLVSARDNGNLFWSFSAFFFFLLCLLFPMPARVQPPNLKAWDATHGGTWEWLEKKNLIPKTQLILT